MKKHAAINCIMAGAFTKFNTPFEILEI